MQCIKKAIDDLKSLRFTNCSVKPTSVQAQKNGNSLHTAVQLMFVCPTGKHLLRFLTLCQRQEESDGQYDIEFDGDQLLYVEPSSYMIFQRLPEFADQWIPDPSLRKEAYLDLGTCKYNLGNIRNRSTLPAEVVGELEYWDYLVCLFFFLFVICDPLCSLTSCIIYTFYLLIYQNKKVNKLQNVIATFILFYLFRPLDLTEVILSQRLWKELSFLTFFL